MMTHREAEQRSGAHLGLSWGHCRMTNPLWRRLFSPVYPAARQTYVYTPQTEDQRARGSSRPRSRSATIPPGRWSCVLGSESTAGPGRTTCRNHDHKLWRQSTTTLVRRLVRCFLQNLVSIAIKKHLRVLINLQMFHLRKSNKTHFPKPEVIAFICFCYCFNQQKRKRKTWRKTLKEQKKCLQGTIAAADLFHLDRPYFWSLPSRK